MFSGTLSTLASGLLTLSLAASPLPAQAAPPVPPGPPRPVSQRVVIAPAPANAPGRYFQHEPRANAFFSETGLQVRLAPAQRPARELGWGLVGAQSVVPQPLQPRQARLHQFTGPTQTRQRGLPTWGALYYPEVAPGVELWLESREAGVGYSLRAARGSHLAQVWLEWRGAQALRVADGGRALEIQLADGHLREEGLQCGQERKDGTSYAVPCRYREVRATDTGRWQYLIEVDVKEPGRPAWVDPLIQWSTYLGNVSEEVLDGLAIIREGINSGDILTVGSSGDNDYDALEPVLPGEKLGPGGFVDVVVSRFGPSGELKWISVIGGAANDVGSSIALGPGGDIFVAGGTLSANLQTGGGTAFQGATDGFIARLKEDGSELRSFTYLGGTGDEFIYGLTFGADGKLYAVGSTSSPSMPGTTGGAGADGGTDVFVSRFSAAGTLEKTLLGGGSNDDVGYGITSSVQSDGGTALYVTGYTESPNFPSTNGQPASATNRQALVAGLSSQLNGALWLFLLGGMTGPDEGYRVLFVPDPPPGRVLVVGTSQSSDFPVSPVVPIPGGRNAFLSSFAATTGEPGFSTVLGGSGNEEGFAITQGPRQSVFIGGRTTSQTLPAGGGFDMTSQGQEGYVLQLVPEGTHYVPAWGTFVGGSLGDEVRALAFTAENALIIGGVTLSSDALQGPTVGDPSYQGRTDMFLFSLAAADFSPPVLVRLLDGVGADRDEQTSSTTLQASWEFQDPESAITQYEVAAGTAPGCENIAPFASVETRTSEDLMAPGRMRPLAPGTWYFVTVRATNAAGLQTTASTDGVFVRSLDGGTGPIPPPPGEGDCPSGPSPGTGNGEGPQSPLGWSCGTPGGPGGVLLLLLLALGLRGARSSRAVGKTPGLPRSEPQ